MVSNLPVNLVVPFKVGISLALSIFAAIRWSFFKVFHFLKASLRLSPINPWSVSFLLRSTVPNNCSGVALLLILLPLTFGGGILSSALKNLDFAYRLAKLNGMLILFSCEFSMVFPSSYASLLAPIQL